MHIGKTLGEIVADFRRKNDMSMGDFAKLCGLSKAYISQLERNINPATGKPPMPSINTIDAIARAMRRELNDVMFEMSSDPQEIEDDKSADDISLIKHIFIEEIMAMTDDDAKQFYSLLEMWRGTKK